MTGSVPPIRPQSVLRAATPVLDVAYLDSGPRDGHPVLLLHGWPDGAHGWAEVAAHLNRAGLRTVAPWLRGFGPTRFRRPDTPRSAQIAALAQDAFDLADALGLATFSLVGHDWGARAGYLMAAAAPDRVRRYVALSVGYGGGPLSPRQQRQFWYQWFFAHPEGERTLRGDPLAIVRQLRADWSPGWAGSEAGLAAVIDNPDWIDLTLHGYRHRWGLAPGDARYDGLERLQRAQPSIAVPTLLLHGADDGCIEPAASAGREGRFGGPYLRQVLPGVGHFPQNDAPEATAHAIVAWLQAGAGAAP